MNPTLLRWLHLTDLHVGKNSQSQEVAFASLLQSVTERAAGKPFDVVVLTGDLVYSGKADEFNRLDQLLIKQLRDSVLCRDAKFLAVPGNHDLDCDIGAPLSWSGLGSRKEYIFDTDQRGVQLREHRAKAFSEYSKFAARSGLLTVDPLATPATSHSIEIGGKKFRFVCLVTAFFSDKDKELTDKHRAPIPVQPLRSALSNLLSDEIPIVLGHHPAEWFLSDSADHFRTLLIESKALYLHGHEHAIIPKSSNSGLTSLGFGAAYQASPENSSPSPYRNSFAICELANDLHVAITSWDNENGKWRPEQRLPADFSQPSDRLNGGYVLNLPNTLITARASAPLAQLAAAVRKDTHITSCIWLERNDTKRWNEILISIGKITPYAMAYKLPHQLMPIGHTQFRVDDGRSKYLVYAIASTGDVLHQDQVQKINTLLDTEDYDGCFVLTLGALAKEAQTLAAQLSLRKPIFVLERDEIVRLVSRTLSLEQMRTLEGFEPDKIKATLIISENGLALLCEDKTHDTWFLLIDENGDVPPESSSLVCAVRDNDPALSRLTYGYGLKAQLSNHAMESFDKSEYLRRSHAYFDDVKYAPLAALGMRFKKASLTEMYVAASADVGGSTKSSQNASRAISEFVESLGLTVSQRELLESQLRARYGLDYTAEVGAATQLYQRFNNIVVLGDPGSGKTCFVKHEILAYCTRFESDSWYSRHVPIYLSLAEAAKLLTEQSDILDICQIQYARRGIELQKSHVERLLSEGCAAFFFDGLDEVGFIDKRINLMAEIGRLVKSYAARGNRFVIASRPAAVQPVDVPDAFTYVQLKGLSESEMRILAGKVMTARLDESDPQELESDESALIERLLADTRNSPGIARIARNPLLLTLLVLIYANTGALSAKRHSIYSQAIKTLVSVRGRDLREQQISEADLRTRLGAFAVAVFRRDIDEIPKRSDVVEVLAPVLAHARQIPIERAKEQTNTFIQEVAEATGLLSIHPDADQNVEEDLVTFMHYSFLEYYSAAGLLSSNYDEVLTRLSRNPRWKDVTTLMFGILSDYSDVTPQLRKLIEDQSPTENITKYKLLLAMDCASECDVPPEGAQDLLAEQIFETIANGAGKFSIDLRSEIADRLKYFLQGAGPRIESALVRGLLDHNPLCKAAFCDLLSRLDHTIRLPLGVIEAFQQCLNEKSSIVQTAAILAIEKHPSLRSDATQTILKRALAGSIAEKHAALKVIAIAPEYQDALIASIRPLLNDPNILVSSLAANCMLAYDLMGEHGNGGVREQVLSKLNQSEHDVGNTKNFVTVDPRSLETMLGDERLEVRELAVRYLPLVEVDPNLVHRSLSKMLRSETTSTIVAAILDCFRKIDGAIPFITIADTDFVCQLLKAKERNVRTAAIKLLGELPDDEKVLQSLTNLLSTLNGAVGRDGEITEAARALAQHVRRNPNLRDDMLKIVLQYLPESVSEGFGDITRQHHIRELLFVCESIGGADEKTAQRVLKFAEDFRTPDRIRSQSIRVFGRLAEPTAANATILCELLKQNSPRFRDAVYSAATSFIKRCRAKVEYVRRVNGELQYLSVCLSDAWRRETSGHIESIAPTAATDIRAAIIEIENLTAAYEEFAERAQLRF